MFPSAVRVASVVVLLAAIGCPAFPQQAQPGAATIDFNSHYHFPLSFGVEYAVALPLVDLAESHFVQEIASSARFPFARSPAFQPLLRAGVTLFDADMERETQIWDHTDVFLSAGMHMSHRLNASLELGARVTAGYSLGVFPNAAADGGTLTSPNIIADSGLSLSISPVFNWAVQIGSSLRYLRSLSPLEKYSGLYLLGGATLHMRLGSDPDSARDSVRSIRFADAHVDPVFAAMQSYYAENSIGAITITNVDTEPVHDVSVSFLQGGFMDSPTPVGYLESLEPNESRVFPIRAIFNEEVFEIEGVSTLVGEVIVEYRTRGAAAEQRSSLSYELHDKTALTWDDDRKMGAFITPADSYIAAFAVETRSIAREAEVSALPGQLQFAVQAYHAIALKGVFYQPDPASPFALVQGNEYRVDRVNLPRETLDRMAGDCDDLTALYASILEAGGVDTAFVTTPGHIFVGVNTGVPADRSADVHPDPSMVMVIDDETWILVEITLLGRADFLEAWRTGMEEYQLYREHPSARGFYRTHEAQTVFRPVVLRSRSGRAPVEHAEELKDFFESDIASLASALMGDRRTAAETRDRARDWMRYGILAAQLEQFGVAETAFRTAGTRADGNRLEVLVNTGSMYYLQSRYSDAVSVLTQAQELADQTERVRPRTEAALLLNLAKAHYELEQFQQAAVAFEKAAVIAPEVNVRYAYLNAETTNGETRAADSSRRDVMFVGVE